MPSGLSGIIGGVQGQSLASLNPNLARLFQQQGGPPGSPPQAGEVMQSPGFDPNIYRGGIGGVLAQRFAPMQPQPLSPQQAAGILQNAQTPQGYMAGLQGGGGMQQPSPLAGLQQMGGMGGMWGALAQKLQNQMGQQYPQQPQQPPPLSPQQASSILQQAQQPSPLAGLQQMGGMGGMWGALAQKLQAHLAQNGYGG